MNSEFTVVFYTLEGKDSTQNTVATNVENL